MHPRSSVATFFFNCWCFFLSLRDAIFYSIGLSTVNFCKFLCSLTTSNMSVTYVCRYLILVFLLLAFKQCNPRFLHKSEQCSTKWASVSFIPSLYQQVICGIFCLLTYFVWRKLKNYCYDCYKFFSFSNLWSWFSVKYPVKSSHYRRCTPRFIFLQ